MSSFEGEKPQEADPFGFNGVDSGTYGRCLAFIHRLAEHEPSCVGRCSACVESKSPCVRPVGKKTCVTCPTPEKCRDPSHEYRALPRGSEQCYMCLQFVGNIYSHVRECRGRCQNCVTDDKPCKREEGKRDCNNCLTKKAICKVEDKLACMVPCRFCGREYIKSMIKGHQKRCPGKCSNCKDARGDEGHEIVCFHPPPFTSRGSCKRCAEMRDNLDRGCDGGWRRPKHQRCETEDEADVEDNESSEHGAEDADEDSESWD